MYLVQARNIDFLMQYLNTCIMAPIPGRNYFNLILLMIKK